MDAASPRPNRVRPALRGFFAGTVVYASTMAPAAAAPPGMTEPVHRVANAATALTPRADRADRVDRAAATPAPAATPSVAPAEHPLDRALALASRALERSRREISDYTALMVKRERIDGVVSDPQYMTLKVRNHKEANGAVTQPFSVYLGFLKPAAVKGREVMFVEGRNEGNLTAHEGGFKGRFLPTVQLAPTGMMAMRGQRYPVTEVGLEKLLEKLLERGGRARRAPDVRCEFRQGARVKDRTCTVIQVVQPTYAADNEFHTAQIFLDDELGLPIRYAAYDYPKGGATTGEVIEEYTYVNLRVNPGLTDADFDPANPAYGF